MCNSFCELCWKSTTILWIQATNSVWHLILWLSITLISFSQNYCRQNQVSIVSCASQLNMWPTPYQQWTDNMYLRKIVLYQKFSFSIFKSPQKEFGRLQKKWKNQRPRKYMKQIKNIFNTSERIWWNTRVLDCGDMIESVCYFWCK